MHLHIHSTRIYIIRTHQNQKSFLADKGEYKQLKSSKSYMFDMDVSKNSGFPPKSSILIGFSIINHPFWGPSTPIFGNSHMFWFSGSGRKDWDWPGVAGYHWHRRQVTSWCPSTWAYWFDRGRVGDDDERWWNMWNMCIYSISYINNYVWCCFFSSFEKLWFQYLWNKDIEKDPWEHC